MFLLRHRCRRLLVIFARLRFRLLVVGFGLFRFLLAATHQRVQELPPVIHDEPQPVALLIMLAQLPEQHRLHDINARFLFREINFQLRQARPRTRHKLPQLLQLRIDVND